MTSSHTALLAFPRLPELVRKAHIFLSMRNKALLSLGQFCENEYDVLLTKITISINHHHSPALSLQGHRNKTTVMWTIDISISPTPTNVKSSNVYKLNKKRDIVTYLHKAAVSPVPSTWINAIEHRFFTSWTGLTTELVKKYLPKSAAIVKGHLWKVQQNLRTTQPKPKTPPPLNEPVMTTELPSIPVREKK